MADTILTYLYPQIDVPFIIGEQSGFKDVYKRQIKDFPPIRVCVTVGFICSMWAVDLTGFKASSAQLYVAAISAAMLGLYAFT